MQRHCRYAVVWVAGRDLPSVASQQVTTADVPVDEFGAKDLRRVLELKLDHKSRPLWVVSPLLFVSPSLLFVCI